MGREAPDSPRTTLLMMVYVMKLQPRDQEIDDDEHDNMKHAIETVWTQITCDGCEYEIV